MCSKEHTEHVLARNFDYINFSLLWQPFPVTIALIKVKLIPDFYTWVIRLINQLAEIGENNFLFWASEGAKLIP